MMLRNARVVDLCTGLASEPTDLVVADGVLRPIEARPGEVIDLEGGFVLPGLWDEHVHLGQWAMHRHRVQLPACASARECATLVGRLVAERGGLEPFVAIGFRDATWPDRPSLAALDEATGRVPVVLVSGDMHTVWANSAGLAHFGMSSRTGHLVEAEAFEMELRIGRLPDEQLDALVTSAARELARLGVVGVTEIECADNPLAWGRRMAAGFEGLRVRASVWPQHLTAALRRGHRTGQALDERGLLTMGPLKVIVDGSMTARTAWCHEVYPEPHPDRPRGLLSIDRDELLELVHSAHAGGLEVALHAIGDAAVGLVLDAFEQTRARGSIEHCQLVAPDDITRMARLGVRASVQPSHLAASTAATERVWGDRSERVAPWRAMVDAGVELRLGSDAPVVEPNPWQAIQDAVLRGRDGTCWHPEQSLNLAEALRASTGGVTALRPGGPADLCVLDANPFELPVDELGSLTSRLTMVAGRTTHGA